MRRLCPVDVRFASSSVPMVRRPGRISRRLDSRISVTLRLVRPFHGLVLDRSQSAVWPTGPRPVSSRPERRKTEPLPHPSPRPHPRPAAHPSPRPPRRPILLIGLPLPTRLGLCSTSVPERTAPSTLPSIPRPNRLLLLGAGRELIETRPSSRITAASSRIELRGRSPPGDASSPAAAASRSPFRPADPRGIPDPFEPKLVHPGRRWTAEFVRIHGLEPRLARDGRGPCATGASPILDPARADSPIPAESPFQPLERPSVRRGLCQRRAGRADADGEPLAAFDLTFLGSPDPRARSFRSERGS